MKSPLANTALALGLLLSVSLALQPPASAGTSTAPAGGPGLPDLIVDQAALRQHWIVRVENFDPGTCSVREGGVTPGEHPIVRFTVSTPNIGDADLVVGDPNEHITANDGLYEYSLCHAHYHFRHYALYQLIDPVTGHVWRAAKRGFCMLDLEKYGDYPGPNNNPYHFRSCGAPGVPGNQGISKGWADVYVWQLGGQYFVLDGGDGQDPVPPGEYIIRITVNPGFVPVGVEPCRYADPNHAGVCHQLPESNFDNNVAEVRITIPDHPGRQGVGPLKDQAASTPLLEVEP
jgi:hypothetical protein